MNTIEPITVLIAAVFLFFVGRFIMLWYYKIDERLTQQYETNRLLRKIAGEPDLKPNEYLRQARSKYSDRVSVENINKNSQVQE